MRFSLSTTCDHVTVKLGFQRGGKATGKPQGGSFHRVSSQCYRTRGQVPQTQGNDPPGCPQAPQTTPVHTEPSSSHCPNLPNEQTASPVFPAVLNEIRVPELASLLHPLLDVIYRHKGVIPPQNFLECSSPSPILARLPVPFSL